MNRILLFILSLVVQKAMAQLTISPNPVTINTGTITITYGAQGDYSLFDPMGNPNLLLYKGLETNGVAATWDYHDDFTNTATFVPFNYDTTVNAYVAQINVAARIYQQEPSLTVMTVPQGTQVNDFYFLIITPDLSRQSADLKGTDYGWQAATLSNRFVRDVDLGVVAVSDGLVFTTAGTYNITNYTLDGKLVDKVKLFIPAGFYTQQLQSGVTYITVIAQDSKRQVFKWVDY